LLETAYAGAALHPHPEDAMNFLQKSILIIAPLSPYLMNLPVPEDSVSHWTVGVAAGVGQMADVSRDCEGNVVSVENIQFADIGAAVRYTNEPFTAYLSGGTTSAWMEYPSYTYQSDYPVLKHQTKAVPYCVPMIGIDTKYVGLEAGWLVIFDKGEHLTLGPDLEVGEGGMPAGSLRLGNRAKTHFSMGLARNLPLVAGGLYDMGLSTPVGKNGSQLFFGMGVGPYNGPVLALKGDIRIGDRFIFIPRLGVKAWETFEYGLSIGGGYRF
jgi:hypothetical protein